MNNEKLIKWIREHDTNPWTQGKGHSYHYGYNRALSNVLARIDYNADDKLNKIKQKIKEKKEYYEMLNSLDPFDYGVLYICDILLAEINNIERQQ